ncbi:MAG: phosphoglucosamine mutase [Candidatus Methanomethylicia archaeon]
MKMEDLWKIKSYSGVRGIYGKQITPEIIYRIANAYAHVLNVKKVVVGRDTRPSGIPIKYAAISGLTSIGCKVTDVDISPTPAILYSIKRFNFDGGIVISASHNPPEYNAIKIAKKGGILISDEELDDILKKTSEEVILNKPGSVRFRDINENYITTLMEVMKVECKKGLRVVVDPGGGAGSFTTPKLLSKIGCRVISINTIPGKFNRPIEPTEESLKELSSIVKSVNADMGLAHDCDADRLVCVDEEGRILGEDYSMAIALRNILKHTRIKSIVVNLASSKIFQDIANEFGVKIHWAKVGEINIINKMMEEDSELGVEGSSGGLIFREFHMTRDGAIAALAIIREIIETGKKLSEIVDELPKYHMIKTNIPTNKIRLEDKIDELSSMGEINLMDGIKVSSEDWWILIRRSKTEPKIRIIVESKSSGKAKEIMEKVIHKLS